ncbi:MAG: SH3 domain-containing protein [Aquisalimonadaceae bacterium]
MISRCLLSAVMAIAPHASAFAAPGDLWEVKQYSTNIRNGPGTDHGIVTQAARADVAMELQRQGDWLEILLIDGGQGWIRDDLIDPLTGREADDPTPGFLLFRDMLIGGDGAGGLFLEPDYLGYAVVLLTVTESYLDLPPATREHQLEDLLRLWQTIDNTGIPATIILGLENGRRLASKSALTGTHWFLDD